MAAPATPVQPARPWNPDFNHSDRERWVCIYPAYINSRKSHKEGRQISKSKAVDNPTCGEMRDVCAAAGLTIGVENKVYPRELEPRDPKYRGRLRVQLKDENGTPIHTKFPTRRSVLLYLGATIPKLKTRSQGQGSSAQSSQSSQGRNQKKKGGRKGK